MSRSSEVRETESKDGVGGSPEVREDLGIARNTTFSFNQNKEMSKLETIAKFGMVQTLFQTFSMVMRHSGCPVAKSFPSHDS